MSCNCNKDKKSAVDNQWSGIASAGNSKDRKEKTAVDNQWSSTNKLVSKLGIEESDI